eukprot:4841599-Amphidinium_carterae.1
MEARYGLIDFGLAVDATKWRVGETQIGDGEAPATVRSRYGSTSYSMCFRIGHMGHTSSSCPRVVTSALHELILIWGLPSPFTQGWSGAMRRADCNLGLI